MSGRRYQTVPVPFWFREKSYESFRNMTMKPNDVILSSLVKAGTTWVHKILYSLLHTFDDDGSKRSVNAAGEIGGQGQLYPSSLPVDRDEMNACLADPNDTTSTKFSKQVFGDYTLEDLMNQPEPRLFSTHWFGTKFLPKEFLGDVGENESGGSGSGRLVIVLRNLKDVMVSLHFFRGEAKDGWHGNEHGPGSFNRFLSDDCPNAFGSSFGWIREQEELVTLLQEQAAKHLQKERVLVVYYEALKADLPGEIGRINDFLDLPTLTDSKRKAVAEDCTFSAMKSGTAGNMAKVIMRKGAIGDWNNYLTPKDWSLFDKVYDQQLSNVHLARPLPFYQLSPLAGCPAHKRGECTLHTDPRTWPVFRRQSLENGIMVPDGLVSAKKGATFVRPPSEYNGSIPSEKYPIEGGGRYHLFVSGICPWAQSCATARYLLGLENVISMDIADGQSSRGWVYLDGASIVPWSEREGPFWLHEAYQEDDPKVTTRITVPVLWDTQTNTVVSNDSWTIVKMMAAFAGLGTPPGTMTIDLFTEDGHATLTPSNLESEIESVHTELYNDLLNGVYKAGIGLMRNGDVETPHILTARETIYAKLAELEDGVLSKQRFLLGPKLTAVDIRLTMTLLRWDSSYRGAFSLKGGRGEILVGDGYPNLKGYIRNMYSIIKSVVEFSNFRQYYRIRQALQAASNTPNADIPVEDAEELADLEEIMVSAGKPDNRTF